MHACSKCLPDLRALKAIACPIFETPGIWGENFSRPINPDRCQLSLTVVLKFLVLGCLKNGTLYRHEKEI